MTRRGLIPLAVLAGLAATVAPASAATYCVKKPRCVKAGGTQAPTVGSAIFAAGLSPGFDRIELGPREFSDGPWSAGAGNPVRIVGSGRDKTTLRRSGDANNEVVLSLAAVGSRVSGLAVRLGEGLGVTGIRTPGRVSNVDVSTQSVANQTGVTLEAGGALRGARVRMPRGGSATGIAATAGGARIDRVQVSATFAVTAGNNADAPLITRAKLTGGTHALTVTGSLTLDQALLRMPDGKTAISANFIAPLSGEPRLVGRHLTVVGRGGDYGLAYFVLGDQLFGCPRVSVVLRNSIIRGFATPLTRNANVLLCTGTPKADLNVAWSAFNRSKMQQLGPGKLTAKHILRANPRFVAPKKGNYRLRRGSKLIDRGQPGKPKKGESKRDLDGRKRVLDGDGKRGARRDIGAYELKPKRKKRKR